MTEDEQITLGMYAGDLLQQEFFGVIAKLYEDNLVQHLFSTTPAEKAERDHLYSCMTGVRDFFNLMLTLTKSKDALIEKNELLSMPDAGQDADYILEE